MPSQCLADTVPHQPLSNSSHVYALVVFREFIHWSWSHAGTRNDKTKSRFDPFLRTLREGRWDHITFETLLDEDGNTQTHNRPWVLVDGGFHMWRDFQFPDRMETEFWPVQCSERKESVRKDSEDSIGLLNIRFWQLQVPLRFRSRAVIDHLHRTCVALHNMIMRHDGLHDLGQYEVDWLTQDMRNVMRMERRHKRKNERSRARQQNVQARKRKPGKGGRTRTPGPAPRPVGQGVGVNKTSAPFDEAAAGNDVVPELEEGWADLKHALDKHYEFSVKRGEAQWLRTAESLGLCPQKVSLFVSEGRGAHGGDDEDEDEDEAEGEDEDEDF